MRGQEQRLLPEVYASGGRRDEQGILSFPVCGQPAAMQELARGPGRVHRSIPAIAGEVHLPGSLRVQLAGGWRELVEILVLPAGVLQPERRLENRTCCRMQSLRRPCSRTGCRIPFLQKQALREMALPEWEYVPEPGILQGLFQGFYLSGGFPQPSSWAPSGGSGQQVPMGAVSYRFPV